MAVVTLALGAGRWRILRRLLSECMLVALAGRAVGLLMAEWGMEALIVAIPQDLLRAMPYLHALSIDGRILAFTSGLSLLTAVIFGLVPPRQASQPVTLGLSFVNN